MQTRLLSSGFLGYLFKEIENIALIIERYETYNEQSEYDDGQDIGHIKSHRIFDFYAFACVRFHSEIFPTPAFFARAVQYVNERADGQQNVAY